MSQSPVGSVIQLHELPDLTPLLAKVAAAALPIPGVGGGGGGGETLPQTSVVLPGAPIDIDHVAAYADVCGFRLDSTLPPTYLHLLGFPLSVLLMTRPDFPFGLMGMVHIANRITVHRPVKVDEVVDLTATVTNLRAHPKGQQMDNVVTISIGEETVWESTSTYLKRGASNPGHDASEPTGAAGVNLAELPMTARWRVPDDIGRRYGRVSGDRNPIHLTAMTAKAFGFPRAIAHGMWTKARCLAALEGGIPQACTIDVAFKLPLLLPSAVHYATRREPDGWSFGVRAKDGKPHLVGAVTAVSEHD
ncbi:MAG: MaoC/PaaZ C-terminal domain-containing protein [Euzebya sp.]